jgi:non-ribosomal peptide synthetase component E (peptide arylation enzyme)
VSGHNIGTAEVESALVAHPAVSSCGVLALFLPFLFSVLFALRGKKPRDVAF